MGGRSDGGCGFDLRTEEQVHRGARGVFASTSSCEGGGRRGRENRAEREFKELAVTLVVFVGDVEQKLTRGESALLVRRDVHNSQTVGAPCPERLFEQVEIGDACAAPQVFVKLRFGGFDDNQVMSKTADPPGLVRELHPVAAEVIREVVGGFALDADEALVAQKRVVAGDEFGAADFEAVKLKGAPFPLVDDEGEVGGLEQVHAVSPDARAAPQWAADQDHCSEKREPRVLK